ncbi:MAG: zinc-binding dehydrogenase, partial [Rothia sp. (in: high G+C Gram-positive bacteria)]|uniref:zinc-binding dehydrogenase n=1 Tax=Rothia sp. (in: high G+C Gram-positive bacteria) TaxID=1885016 RepID=UPI0026E0314B
ATSLRTRSADEKARIMAGVRQQVLPLVESGAIRANLDRTFALEQAARAHTYFDSGEHRGRLCSPSAKTRYSGGLAAVLPQKLLCWAQGTIRFFTKPV